MIGFLLGYLLGKSERKQCYEHSIFENYPKSPRRPKAHLRA